jgi:two-component system sensor histidine kinase VicK
MIALVNDLLNVSRLELGTIKLEPRPFDLVATINGIVKDLEAEVRTRDITIEQKFGPGLELVVSDPWHVQVITQNLLSNAVKYSPPGQHVTITAKRQADELVLTVKDHGYGIPRRQQSKVFTKLFRADNARKAVSDGSGLGLYVCKAMVEQLGGKIWFESTEGKGSTFHVSLPWLDVIDDSVKLA